MGYFDNAFFPAVENDEVAVASFLEACTYLPKFLDLLSGALKLVKGDIEGNIRKIRHVYDKDPERLRTLRSLLLDEMQRNVYKKDPSACVGLLWLKRGLDYVMMMLHLVVESFRKGVTSESCTAEFRGAYEYALKRHHGWIQQKVFQAGLVTFPKRKHLLKCLATGSDVPMAEVIQRTSAYLQSLRPIIDYINRLYVDLKLEPNEATYPKDFAASAAENADAATASSESGASHDAGENKARNEAASPDSQAHSD